MRNLASSACPGPCLESSDRGAAPVYQALPCNAVRRPWKASIPCIPQTCAQQNRQYRPGGFPHAGRHSGSRADGQPPGPCRWQLRTDTGIHMEDRRLLHTGLADSPASVATGPVCPASASQGAPCIMETSRAGNAPDLGTEPMTINFTRARRHMGYTVRLLPPSRQHASRTAGLQRQDRPIPIPHSCPESPAWI